MGINSFNAYWEKHGGRQEAILIAFNQLDNDGLDGRPFSGYDGQEGVFYLDDKEISLTNNKSDSAKGQINSIDFVEWPLERVVSFFNLVTTGGSFE